MKLNKNNFFFFFLKKNLRYSQGTITITYSTHFKLFYWTIVDFYFNIYNIHYPIRPGTKGIPELGSQMVPLIKFSTV